MKLGLVNMDFDYCTYFGLEHSTGYERLLRDCMAGECHSLSAIGHGRSRMECDSAYSGCLARSSRARFPELCGRLMGPSRQTIC